MGSEAQLGILSMASLLASDQSAAEAVLELCKYLTRPGGLDRAPKGTFKS